MKLTHKQRMFADEYLKCGNATEAAQKAGYSDKSARFVGSENLTKPNIKSYIDKRRKEIESHKIADAKEVMEFYSSVLRGESTETVVVSTPFGMKKTEKEPDIKTRLSAGRELMKRYPTNNPVVEQQLRKLKADAELAEYKANLVTNPDKIKDKTIIIDDIPKENDNGENN